MAVLFWVLVGFATVSCLFMAWSLGANSNSPPFAPAIGANAVSTMRAAFLVGILAAAGAVAQGGAISETVGAALIDGVSITPLAASAGLLVAAAFMMFGVYSGYPVPAAFATTGAILAHVRMGVIPHPTRSEGSVSEAVSLALGRPTVLGIDVLAIVVTLVFAAVAFRAIRRRTQTSVENGIRTFLLVLGGVVAFSSGGSQVGLATGPLENLYGVELGLPGIVLLVIGATGILAGAWMGAPRLLQATSREYAQLGPRRSIAALVPGFIIAQLAIALGIPISFNNIIISGVIGGGLAAGSAGVSRRKIGVTIAFWILTLGTSIGLGFGLYRLVSSLLGIQ